MNQFQIIRPAAGDSFSDALSSILAQMEGMDPVFVRFFLSDAQNQACGAAVFAKIQIIN